MATKESQTDGFGSGTLVECGVMTDVPTVDEKGVNTRSRSLQQMGQRIRSEDSGDSSDPRRRAAAARRRGDRGGADAGGNQDGFDGDDFGDDGDSAGGGGGRVLAPSRRAGQMSHHPRSLDSDEVFYDADSHASRHLAARQ
jgi:hypothetical protein